VEEIFSQGKVEDKGKQDGDGFRNHEVQAKNIGKTPHEEGIDQQNKGGNEEIITELMMPLFDDPHIKDPEGAEKIIQCCS
jgi:hypothetical protein